MKTVVFLILSMFLLSPAISYSQNETEDNREELQFGIMAGLSFSNVWDEREDDLVADGKVGAVAGVVLSIPIGMYLGFQPEAVFVQKGFKGDARYEGAAFSLTRTTNHLDFPLQLKFKPVKNFSLLGGPYYSFLLSKKSEMDLGNLTLVQQETIKNDKIQENVYGLIFGAEANFNAITVAAKAAWDMKQNTDDGESRLPRYKNQWIQLTVGLNL